MTDKVVTVIVAAYNHEKYIVECLESIVNQTYKNIQLVVINDGSTDNTHEQIMSIQQKLNKRFIQYKYINKKNEGICKTINLGLTYATGDFIILSASDDYMINTRIEKTVEKFNDNHNIGVVYSDLYDIKTEEKLVDNIMEGELWSDKVVPLEGDIIEFMLEEVFLMPTVTACFRRECYDKVGNYDENLLCEDPDMFLRTARYFEYGYIDEPLMLHRIHATNSGRNPDIIVPTIRRMIEKYNKVDWLTQEQKYKLISMLNRNIGKIVFKNPNKVKNNPLVIWGTGSRYLDNKQELGTNIEFFIDSNESRHEKLFEGKKVYGPEQLEEIKGKKYYIVVCSSFYKQIYPKLEEKGFVLGRDFE